MPAENENTYYEGESKGASIKFKQKFNQKLAVLKQILTSWPTIVSLIYLLFPIDLIPDAAPVIGQIDDLVFILWAMVEAVEKIKRRKEDITGTYREI